MTENLTDMEQEGIGSSLQTSVSGLDGDFVDSVDTVDTVETEQNSVVNTHGDAKEEESSSFIDAESLADNNISSTSESVVGGGENVMVERVSTAMSEVEKNTASDEDNGDDDQAQDAGKEETFVDAMDQLNMSDARSIDVGDSTVYVETREDLEDKVDIQVVEDSTQVRQLMYELSLLQASLDKTVDDKEMAEKKYKEERETLSSQLANLHQQLEVMADRQNGNGLVRRLGQAENEDEEGKLQDSDVPLQTMIADCSNLTMVLKSTLEEQLQSEGTIRELHAVLYRKDQEIEELNAEVNEISVSHDVIVSYLESLQTVWSQSLKESSEENLERDLHIEAVTKRLLSSLASVVQQGDLSDDSFTERISHVEKSTVLMIENYNRFISEIDHLKQCLNESLSEIQLPGETEPETVFTIVRDELLGHKRKELDFVEKLNQVEVENKKLLEQLDEEKGRIEVADAELSKIRLELEQEKNKSASTKEKLSLAVTKGKALVQHRDSLKQALSEKANELEKCLLEIKEKSNALEAAELRMEELVKTESFSVSLQASLSERDMVLKEIEKILAQTDMANGFQSLDVLGSVRWLADQRNVLLGVSMEYDKLKDSITALSLPETVASYELGSQINWLGKSLSLARDNIVKLQGEIVSTQVSLASHESELTEAYGEIDHLKASLLAEKQEKDSIKIEKDSIQMGLEDLSCKYEAIVEREFQLSSEKDRMLRILLEASGMENQAEGNLPYSEMALFVKNCIGKIKEQVLASFDASDDRKEQFEEVQSLLYVRDQELILYKEMLEEDMLGRSEATNLSNELKRVSLELMALKEERASLQKDLERSAEKSSLIREKLSMAVKKGKGLVQEREGLRRSLDEKNTEIEKLKLAFQQQESVVNECRDQINRLSRDLEHIPKLESDLLAMKDQRDQLEKFLLESNSMLQKVVESIESVALPVETTFEDPVEKVKYLVESFNEYQVGKAYAERESEKGKEEAVSLSIKLAESHQTIKSLEAALSELEKNSSLLEEEKKETQAQKTYVEQELEKAKEEAVSLSIKLAESHQTIKSLEAALSDLEKNSSLLVEEKKETQVQKTYVEQELDKAKEEATSLASKFAEASVHMKSLEDALSLSEKNISLLREEKAAADTAKTYAEDELEKVREEAINQAGKLAETDITIKSLEESLHQVEKNVAFLTEEKDAADISRASLEKKLEEVKREASASIKSLEDALSVASSNISVLVDGKKDAEKEIEALNTRLRESMEELSGTHGSLESQSVELFGHLNHLKMVMKDDALFSSMTQGFNKKLVYLRDMNFLLENIWDRCVEKGLNEMQNNPGAEEDTPEMKNFSKYHDGLPNGTIDNTETCETNLSDIFPYIAKIVEGFQKKNKLLKDKFEGFSSSMDELIADILRVVLETKEKVTGMLEHMESLKLEVKNLEADKQAQVSTISTLKNDATVLLSAWEAITKELQFEGNNGWADLGSNLEIEKLIPGLQYVTREASEDAIAEHWERLGGIKHVKDAETLVLAAREVRNQIKELENVKTVSLATIEDLQNKLQQAYLTSENAIEERDLSQERVSKLEKKLEALQSFCDEMNVRIQNYQAKEDLLKEKEGEFSSLHHSLSRKDQEANGCSLSESQVKTLFEKVNQIELPLEDSDFEKLEFNGSVPVKKLFAIIDTVAELQDQIQTLSGDNEELQASLVAQTQEMGRLKNEVESLTNVDQELGKTKSDLNELTLDLEKLIQMLGGDILAEDKKFAGVKGFFPLLENRFKSITLECEILRSNAQESDARLHDNQKEVDDLSAKLKLLDDSINSRPALPDPVLERSMFEASSVAAVSEISEIEDTAPLGRNSISPAPSAAHVRTLKKGSSDQLAINIDPEADRLINHHETDDDKGHVFKSLNTSGFIPKQGKLIADRIDGIWVSGGRVLMSRPRARIGVIAYCLLLHIWLLGAIL